MRTWAVLFLILPLLAGCATDPEPVAPEPFPLQVYRFAYEGSDVAVDGTQHGWLIRVSNPTDLAYETTILPSGLDDALVGPVGPTSGAAPQEVFLPARIEDGRALAPPPLLLEPGASGVFLVKVDAYNGTGDERTVGFRAFATRVSQPSTVIEAYRSTWPVQVRPATTAVAAGDHVSTRTVGVWINGTSFYTNAADLLGDPAFPAAFSRNDTGSEDLPIYVYGSDRSEQPEGSKDACRFTTITGYNDLLLTQAEASTGVALLRPEAAYTVAGNEDHFLYGHPLIFLNTVVSHDGSTGPTDVPPDPTGPCFQDRLEGIPVPG